MQWIDRIKSRKLLKENSIKLPLTRSSYGKDVSLQVEESARFNRVDFHCRNLEIGAYSYMHSGELYMVSKIGRYCSIAERVIIGVDPVGHPLDWLSSHPFQYTKKHSPIDPSLTYESEWQDVEIGNDVWIGQEAMIMKGVKIGNGAIIGARSIVTQNVPEYAIAVGIPAKVIKYRFSGDVIAKLKDYPWWRLSPADLNKILFDDIFAAIEQLAEVASWDNKAFNEISVSIKNNKVIFKGE